MSLALYMNEHVHRAVTNGLRLRDVDVLTVQEDGRTGFPDPLVLDLLRNALGQTQVLELFVFFAR